MQRSHTDYLQPQIPEGTLVFSEQGNRDKIGMQASDLPSVYGH